jgi:hypothetical protein
LRTSLENRAIVEIAMNTFINDVRFAVRLLARNPMLTLVAALSLGLGIGANTTIFSLINEVFLRPLPLKDPSSLVAVFTADERNRLQAFGGFMATSRLNYQDYLDQNEVFDGLVAHSFTGLSLSGGGEPEQVPAEIVSPGYFQVLGAPIAVGRAFLPDEERVIGAAPVTVLSHGLWQRRVVTEPWSVRRSQSTAGRSLWSASPRKASKEPTRLAAANSGSPSRCTAKPSAGSHSRIGTHGGRCSSRSRADSSPASRWTRQARR